MSYWYSSIWRPHSVTEVIEHLIYVLPVGVRQVVPPLVSLLHTVKKDVRERYNQFTGVAKPILLNEGLKFIVGLRVYGYIHTLAHFALRLRYCSRQANRQHTAQYVDLPSLLCTLLWNSDSGFVCPHLWHFFPVLLVSDFHPHCSPDRSPLAVAHAKHTWLDVSLLCLTASGKSSSGLVRRHIRQVFMVFVFFD